MRITSGHVGRVDSARWYRGPPDRVGGGYPKQKGGVIRPTDGEEALATLPPSA